MNISRSARSIARGFAALTAAAVLTSVFAGPATADPAPEAPAPVTSAAPSTAPSTSEVPADPPVSTPPAPVSPAPESKPAAAQPAERAQIKVSAVLGKTAYASDEDVHATFELTNIGPTRAVGLSVAQDITAPTDLVVPYDPGWGPLRPSSEPGLDLEPGAAFKLEITGKIRDIRQATTVLRGVVFDATGFGVGEFTASAAVVRAPAHLTGVVYGDKNGNGTRETGEELPGAKLTLRYVHSDITYSITSDAQGRLDSSDVPAAEYYLGGEVVDGWLIPWRTVRIGADTDLTVRGVPPLNGALTASMAFTKNSYQVGELAHVTVTLSNSGPIPLTGIVAACNRIGDGHLLSGRGQGWGDLAGAGVTIAPGETRTFDVTETVPEAAFNRGYVAASCDFGYPEVDIDHHAEAGAQAWVPGAKAVVEGTLGVFDNQGDVKQALAGAKVVLVSDQHCPVTGERTTDAKGHFKFEDVAPGPRYRLYFLLPKSWKTKYENPMEIDVQGPPENHYPWRIEAEEGAGPTPSVPANPADCTAGVPTSTTGAAGGTGGGQSGSSGLASTGVDALGLGALALLALALGGGLVFGARRRRPTA
ncbi:hypothetical protein [Amycolatopsis sp. lyj-346]|uniref:hypothetical protein n=1 Tax=Amycolatopsis sp. lyj-346 TaxID=2789289 RepID=UPI00397C34CD